MCILKVFKGLNSYKDDNSILDVLNYLIRSKYYSGYVLGNLNVSTLNPEIIASEFRNVHDTRNDMEMKSKLHHFVLSLDDSGMSDRAIRSLMIDVRNYFTKAHFQVVVVYHSGSDDSRYNPHLHVVINHCNLRGNLYYGNDNCYIRLKDYLARCTHKQWRYIWASDSDYE